MKVCKYRAMNHRLVQYDDKAFKNRSVEKYLKILFLNKFLDRMLFTFYRLTKGSSLVGQ